MTTLTFDDATLEDFEYIYGLCEATMRSCVESDLGDCFEKIARPTITGLLARGLFKKIRVDGEVVGAIACAQHITHLQLEEIYIEPSRQSEGIGALVLKGVFSNADAHKLPVRLHALASNRARRFYERLGFEVTSATKQVIYMERISQCAVAPVA